MAHELDPDRIGRIGERQFEALCELAGLYCNKSTVDVMGWDFIVEFPTSSADQRLSLDQRLTNAARVQLKSTLGQNDNRIRLSLSSIDRLAKDPGPAVIVVFRLRNDGEVQSGYLVHLIGKELLRILRRLRLAEARRILDINHTSISYNYEKDGVRFEPTPAGLLQALALACGESPGAYSIEKQRQLAELGYEKGQLEAEVVAKVDSLESFSSILLGLAPLKPHGVRVFDSRFGIRLPYQGTFFDDIKTLHLSPPCLGKCEISVRGSGFSEAARFEGEMFVGPPLPTLDGPEFLIRAPGIVMRLTRAGFKFESEGALDDLEMTLEEWAELLRAIALMRTGSASFTISRTENFPSLTIPVTQPITGPYLDDLPVISEFVDGWLKLLVNAGLRSRSRIKFDAFWEANEARMAVNILLNRSSNARFEFQSLGEGEPFSPLEGLYFNSASFAGIAITFSAKVCFEASDHPQWRYRSTRFEGLDVRPQVVDINEYGVDQASMRGLKMLIDPRNVALEPS